LPSVLIDPPRPVQVIDSAGHCVLVTERGVMPMPPARFLLDTAGQQFPVTAWAGPWPVDERWWDPVSHTRLVRLQLVDARGRAYLVYLDQDEKCWYLEGIYD
jgi:protein ImuB